MQSLIVKLIPFESCDVLAAIAIRDGEPLPEPSSVRGHGDIPYDYLNCSEVALLPGDALLECEINLSIRASDWMYRLTVLTKEGELFCFNSYFLSDQNQQMKAQGMPTELQLGSGDLASLVRILHGIRLGFTITQ